MRVFYTPDITSNTLPQEEAMHASKVLRLKEGDEISLINGTGASAIAKVTEITKRSCAYVVLTHTQNSNPVEKLEIAVAPTKSNDRLEWMIEKLTEIGTGKIHLIFTKRTEKSRLKKERIFKKIVAAAKQSHKSHFPELIIHENYPDFLLMCNQEVKLIAHLEDEKRVYIGNELRKEKSTLILIGPEGDFTPEEIKQAIDHSFRPVTLGDFRLRTETAAVFASTLLNNNSYT